MAMGWAPRVAVTHEPWPVWEVLGPGSLGLSGVREELQGLLSCVLLSGAAQVPFEESHRCLNRCCGTVSLQMCASCCAVTQGEGCLGSIVLVWQAWRLLPAVRNAPCP